MTIEEIATGAMSMLDEHWSYYDHDWGRVRCYFCGYAINEDENKMIHDGNCRLTQLKASFNEILFLKKLES